MQASEAYILEAESSVYLQKFAFEYVTAWKSNVSPEERRTAFLNTILASLVWREVRRDKIMNTHRIFQCAVTDALKKIPEVERPVPTVFLDNNRIFKELEGIIMYELRSSVDKQPVSGSQLEIDRIQMLSKLDTGEFYYDLS